jgi:hypothetical protein
MDLSSHLATLFIFYKYKGGDRNIMSNYEVLNVKFENLEKSMSEYRAEAKDDREKFTRAIESLNGSLQELHQNGLKLNMILERQNDKLGYLNDKVEAIEKDIKTIPLQEAESEQQWYRNVISNGAKYLFYILILLLCVSLGLKLEDVFGILK